ncbi:Protein SMG7 [Vitis vinifera]|uniref:Protein SMG7 n=1 Tax=Vitis vinifera TaxID=29760 RepID=A0A438KFS1_VITVI|nr:Protein SMG7 [Vitis vinifera]
MALKAWPLLGQIVVMVVVKELYDLARESYPSSYLLEAWLKWARLRREFLGSISWNRQNFSQLLGDAKASAVKESPVRMTAKGRGKGEAKLPSKDSNMETSIVKGTASKVLSLVSSSLNELLSSGLEEEMNFVHNVNRETEGQTYAEILQRTVLLQNAFTAVFEFMGHILKRCVQICDPSSSYLLPGILVFVEWLACCPDVAVGNDVDEKQATVRLVF